MPYYYDLTRRVTSNGSADTLSTHFKLVTAANQMVARLMGLIAAAKSATAGGGFVYGIRGGAAGSGGTSQTPAKRDPNARAADTAAVNDASAITPGTSPVTQVTVGLAQTGGQNQWVPIDDDHAPKLLPNGGANGNFEIGSKMNGTSIPVELLVEFNES